MKTIRIGSGAGYAGDRLEPSLELIEKGNLDYISYECLAERTIAIGQQAKLKDPSKGYNGLLEHRMEKALPLCWKHKVKLITNMGSANPQAAAQKCVEIARRHGLTGMKIACVTGDDLLPVINKYMDAEVWETHEPLSKLPGEIVSANAYMGVEGILKALEQGADVVITGRVADPAIFMAPMIHEFGWSLEDWDKLGKGTIMGHLLECGGQGAGGNYMYDWRNVPRMDELGFPIAELTDDTFEITKAPDCGGIICEQSCKEQFLYEVHDPANYLTPDVNVDISHATITQVGDNRVRIGGVKGKPRPDTLKLCVGYHKGWKTVSMLSFAWPDAYEKAQYCAEVIMKKMQRRGMKADDIHISYIGLNSLHLGVADMSEEALKNLNECVLRIAVFSEDKSECAKIIPEISPMQLNGPPGASFFGGRARVQEVMALWPTTVPRDAVQVESHILEVK